MNEYINKWIKLKETVELAHWRCHRLSVAKDNNGIMSDAWWVEYIEIPVSNNKSKHSAQYFYYSEIEQLSKSNVKLNKSGGVGWMGNNNIRRKIK